ncbi:hypothetical protein F511_45783 [Dorcoceras hygrometricum]|uniref:Uncharacterized protein n=1 Tax=Dorcoceras hygrometricum TaxID=472368 RepID=A0A2Z6ZV72_9LAMI|nr:hypothetical protein F511_45783 [Dorcoceras hygrometricum]
MADHRATGLHVVAGICATICARHQQHRSARSGEERRIFMRTAARNSRTAATHGRPTRNSLRAQPSPKCAPASASLREGGGHFSAAMRILCACLVRACVQGRGRRTRRRPAAEAAKFV